MDKEVHLEYHSMPSLVNEPVHIFHYIIRSTFFTEDLTFCTKSHDNVARNYNTSQFGDIRSSAVPCGRKRKKHKIATHKRKKKLRMMRHKKK